MTLGLGLVLWLWSGARLAGMGIHEIYSFPATPSPRSSLVQGSDGALYGTTVGGGQYGHGSVFRVTTNGELTTLASFAFTNGASPMAGLAQGDDGAFYGTTCYGGNFGPGYRYGTVFRVTTDGVLTSLVSFNGVNGQNPFQDLLRGRDGAFYGRCGGGNGGMLFRVTASGVLTKLVAFGGTNGTGPNGPLVQGEDGSFYGTTFGGYPPNNVFGTVFRVAANGLLTTLASFVQTNGAHPLAGLGWDDNGMLYGTTSGGGLNNHGTVFRVTTNGMLTRLASFVATTGTSPYAGLVRGRDGAFYGTTSVNGGKYNYGSIIRVTTNGMLTTLAHFNRTNGANPKYANLMEGKDGAFYGTTEKGGQNGCGVVFRVTTNGLLTALASFAHQAGVNPYGPIIRATDGAFYGTTLRGGDFNLGTVFRLASNGVVTTLVSFNDTNGAHPRTGLMQGRDGNLYGTIGGNYDSRISSFGTVFRLTLNGELTNLVRFTGYDGIEPQGPLVQGSDGALYGTTLRGGGFHDAGMVYRLTTNGALTMLAAFDGLNGESPQGGLAEGTDGAFYGTTSYGGAGDDGTIFRVTTNGLLTALISFDGMTGAKGSGGLIRGSDDAFYGTTFAHGGGYSEGTVFRITTNGILTTITTFNTTNGGYPCVRLLQALDGSLYGATTSGGSDNYGTVFRVTTSGAMTTFGSFNYLNGAASNLPGLARIFSGLAQGGDGTIYGATFFGGSLGGGSIYRLDLSGEMLPLTRGDNGWNISFIGLPETVYRVLRSGSTSGPWSAIGNIQVGTNGLASYFDASPAATNAFYRTVHP
jgi:uncharacterized repeat protein (TIGR03803 family)